MGVWDKLVAAVMRASERGAEDDNIRRAPEPVRERLRRDLQRKRYSEGSGARDRADAMADAERG